MPLASRPRLSLPLAPLDRVLQGAALAGAFVLAASLVAIPTMLPASVPLHFGASGVPDRWGSPMELMFLPAIGLVMWAGLAVLACVPHIYNYPVAITEENAPRQYALARQLILWLNAALVWLFALILFETARVASGAADTMGPAIVFVPVAGIFALVAWYIIAAIRQR